MLQITQGNGERALLLAGEVDVSNVGELATALEGVLEVDGDVTLDLSALGFMDSSALALLIRTARDREGSGRLVLRSPGEALLKLFRLTKLDRLPNLAIVHEEGTGSMA